MNLCFVKVGSLTVDILFGVADKEIGSTFQNAEFDGICGLGFASLSVMNKKETFIERLKKQGEILRSVFCFYLNGQYASKGGELIIGGCDVKAEIYIPLSKRGYWEFHLQSLVVSSHSGGDMLICNHCSGILDTGTSLIIGPDESIERINRKLGAKKNHRTGEYNIDCRASNLPTITFQFAVDYTITLYPKDYILRIHAVN